VVGHRLHQALGVGKKFHPQGGIANLTEITVLLAKRKG
jgi:hypothetical protein